MPAPVQTLRVVIFYDDLAAVERAVQALRAELRRAGDDRRLEPSLWQADLLGECQWLRLAAAELSGAERCLLSLSRVDERANDSAVWLHELAPRLARHWRVIPPPAAGPAALQAV
jgi:hypothetical protein